MTNTIFKYPLLMHFITEQQFLPMPVGAQILHVAFQGEGPCLWARVDPAALMERRVFIIIGTCHQPPFVRHVLEKDAQ